MYRLYFKRLFDLIIGLSAVILLFPAFLAVTLALCLTKINPFFTQLRPGLDGKLFKLYKFKTMNDKLDQQGNLLPDSERLTGLGKFLRKTSIDELPQLINVIKGDMSLIGPRPLLPRYLPYYTTEEKIRHELRPGITGWAQVNGRNTSNWNDRLAADIYYYHNLSFLLDVTIIYKTLQSVLASKDIVVDPDSIMDPLDIERSKKASS